jgi:hypothetical protein
MKKILTHLEAQGLQKKPSTGKGVAKKRKGQIRCPKTQTDVFHYFKHNRFYYES